MGQSKTTHSRRRLRRVLLLPLVLAVGAAAIGVSLASQSATADERRDVVAKYLGRWNYDQPDPEANINIAESNVPGRAAVPQIGDIVFTAEDRDTIIGRTDVGCTWRFAATRESLELDPAMQTCHNPTSNVSYTITRWMVTVDGKHERETITAISHHEQDYDFVVANGMRTKAKDFDPRAVRPFVGDWSYRPADQESGVNIRYTYGVGEDGEPTAVPSPELGTVTIIGDYGNRITAHTDDGCTWTLLARGNTARLDPSIQTCTRSQTSAITISFWTMATDGEQLASVVFGTDENGDDFALSIGQLDHG